MGYCNFRLERYPDALAYLEEAVKVNNNYIKGFSLKGQTNLRMNNEALAESDFLKTIELDPLYSFAYYQLFKIFEE